MLKILGTDDSVNTCDCCGKANLKSTVIVDVDGEILHYGSTCATRHTGLSDREIKIAIKTEVDGRKMAAQKEYHNSPEYAAKEAKERAARTAGLIGTPFKAYCREEQAAAYAKAGSLAVVYGLELWSVL